MPTNNSLGLSIPALNPATKQSFNTHPKKISAWISQLPITNIGETSRHVFATITEMNRSDIPPVNRIKAIELFRPTVKFIIDTLEKHFIGAPFPLSVKVRKIAHLCQKLSAEVAISYKIVIEQLLEEKGEKFDKKLMAVAAHRCSIYLGRVIYQCSLVYETIPRNTWKESHRIYAFSERYRLHQLPIKDAENPNKKPNTIEDNYKRSLLLSIADPNHLRQNDTQEVCRIFEECSSKINLVAVNARTKLTEKFFVDIISDSPPVPQPNEAHLQASRGIDVRAVIDHLENALKAENTASTTGFAINSHAKKDLLLRLIKQLSTSKARTFSRQPSGHLFKATLNLTHTYSYLLDMQEQQTARLEPEIIDDPFPDDTTEDWFDQAFRQKIAETKIPGGLMLNDLNILPKDEIYATAPSNNPFLNAPREPQTTSATKKYPIYECTAVNESAGGYCFSWSGDAPSTKIGELVGIISEGQTTQLRVGIVRWIKHPIREALQFGVEMIAPGAVNATILLQDHESKSLLLPEIAVVGQAASLLTEVMKYQPGTQLTVKTHEAEMKVRLTEEIESTSAFARFHFETLTTGTIKTPPTSNSSESEDDLDSLWSML